MTPVLGGLLGGLVTAGLVLVVWRLQARRRPALESRVAPYIRDVPRAFGRWEPVRPSDSATSAFVAVFSPPLRRAAVHLQRLLGGRTSIQRRLERTGSASTVEEFRFSQVLWGIGGFGATLAVGLLGPARQPGRAVPWLLLCLGVAMVAMMVRDQLLTRGARRREDQMLAEFPAVVDLLTLAVAAGEGPVAALDRVVRTCRGALPEDLAVVLAATRTGAPVTDALDGLARRTGLSVVARFAEAFAVAVERGTPLVDVLVAQGADVREASRRQLIEAGARKEVSMMVPVIFLIMPVTLLFAFFPGVVGLNLLAP